MPTSERPVTVLLSAHNGQAYIAEQLVSLRDQSEAARIHLIVRDDGSTDSTVDIIAALDLSPLTVEVWRGPNLGARDSFSALIADAPLSSPTLMLCDQDDCWLADKVRIAEARLTELPGSCPALYFGRSTLTDARLTPLGLTNDAPRGPSLRHALFQNIAPGHTMAFNQELARLYRATINDAAIMHDWWLYCLAAGVGQIVFDPVPHSLYRQHGDNEIGYGTSQLSRLMTNLTRLLKEDRSILTCQAQALDERIGSLLSPENQTMLRTFLAQSSARSRLTYLRRYPLISQKKYPPYLPNLLFLLGRYAKHR